MSENYSHLQKLCLDTIQSGAVSAFIEFFRLTHMEQPMGNNQPQSYDDLIGAAGADASVLAPQFSFDSPLGMPLNQLTNLQKLLQQADSAQLEQDLKTQFCALSALSDMFLQNHKLRLKVKMLPLVVPYPQYTQLSTSKLENILKLIDSPDFQKPILEEDPLIAAVARLRKEKIKTQTYPPVVISYALKARNCMFSYIQKELKNYEINSLIHLLKDSNIEVDPQADVKPLPVEMRLNFIILISMCYLRLAISLQTYSLFRAAYQVYQLFLDAVQDIEQILGAKFSEKFIATDNNGYKQLLADDHLNMNSEKKDDNLAFANLEQASIPKLYPTILDKRQVPCLWDIKPTDLREITVIDKMADDNIEVADQINLKEGKIQDLCEFIYAGRQMAIMNTIQLSCQIYMQQAPSLEDIEVSVGIFDEAFRGKAENLKDKKKETDKMTVSQLGDPALPAEIRCTYQEFTTSIALMHKALKQSLEYKIYSATLPTFKRFAEMISQAGLFALAESLADSVADQNTIFKINALAWKARWARQQNLDKERLKLLSERLTVSQQAAQLDKSAVKYAVSAASELVFNSPGHDVKKMEQAWNELQNSQNGSQVNNAMIEARVRYGAVKGAEKVDTLINKSTIKEPEEGHDEDLDDVVQEEKKEQKVTIVDPKQQQAKKPEVKPEAKQEVKGKK